MKQTSRILFLLCWMILSSCGTGEEPERYTMKQFMDNTEIFGASFSADEKRILFNSQESGIFNAVEIDLSTGEQRTLTRSTTDAVMARSYFPKDDRFVFSQDKGGNEISHLYVQTPDGQVTDLIQDSTAKAGFVDWSHDRNKLYFVSNARDKNFFDLYRVNVGNLSERPQYSAELVYRNDKGLDPAAISPDERYLALTENLSTSNTDIHLLDTQSGLLKSITGHTGDVRNEPQYFTTDGRQLVYLTDEGSEFTYLVSYDLLTGERRKIEDAPWDISSSYLSRSGRYRVVSVNNDARTEIKIYDVAGNQVRITDLPSGDLQGVTFSESENKMAFYISSSRSPADLFVHDFQSRKTLRLTRTISEDIDPEDLVEGRVIRFKSFDGLSVPCLYYKPKGIQEGRKVPALLWIHGGPGGQTRLNFSPEIQFLVNHGYAVVAVNNRGSSGYGKSFFKADDRKHGDADLKDCIAARDHISNFPEIDRNRIGIMGGSYGGYMTMAALTFTPEAFQVGVNLYGVTNWLRTLKSIPPWWGSFRTALYAELGDPFTADSVALYQKSPLFFAHNIIRPFIVLQGSNDPRVLKVESDEIVASARAKGLPVEYIVCPEEGHGFVKEENNIRAMEEILKFLDAHLKGVQEEK